MLQEGKGHRKPPALVREPDVSREQGCSWAGGVRPPSTLPSLCPGDRLLLAEGAALLHAVPELGRPDGRCSPPPRGEVVGTATPLWTLCTRQQSTSPHREPGLRLCLCFLFQLREDVASCQPLATALDNGRVILCDRIADPWVRKDPVPVPVPP